MNPTQQITGEQTAANPVTADEETESVVAMLCRLWDAKPTPN